MEKYAIIADDLTGGMDSGIQAVKKGLSTTLVINEKEVGKLASSADIIVINTASRGYTKEEAYESVKKAVKDLNKKKIKLLYKKIDSTMRGNIGAELEAVLDNTKTDMIIVNPSLPDARRAVLYGELFVNGERISETKFKEDIIAPVKSSYVPTIIKAQTKKNISLLTLFNMQDEEEIVKKIKYHHKDGIEILVSDAYMNKHLLDTAAAIKQSGLNILPCGSAGLLEAYFSLYNQPSCKEKIETKKGSVFVVTSSLNETTKQQIMFAKEQSKTEVITLNTSKLHKKSEIKKSIKRVDQTLNGDGNVIIKSEGYPLSKPSEVVNSIAEILYKTKTNKLAGIMLIGGDTALGCCKKIKADGIRMLDEIEPYVPIGKVIGGKYDRFPIITKAGGLGGEDVIVKAIKYLRGG